MKHVCRLFIMLAFIFAGLTTTAQKITSALELNDYLVSITDSLYQGGKEWGKALNAVVQSKRFDSLGGPRSKMQDFISRKQEEVKNMKDIGESAGLRKAMLEFLDFEAKMMREAFMPLEKLNASSTKDEIKKAIDDLIAMAANEKTNLEKVNVAQEEYAKKNGFTIEEKENDK